MAVVFVTMKSLMTTTTQEMTRRMVKIFINREDWHDQ